MRNVIYKVLFEVNPLLDGEFDFKEEAIAWAKEHLADKPIVKAVDIEFPDEFGGEPIVHEEEEIFHYPVEEVVEDKFDQEELEARLADLEKEINADPEGAALHRDFPQYESVEVKEDMNSEINEVAANWNDIHEELKEEAEPIEEDVILFDPFGCDFSECEPMEVCSDNHRADCCDDICASPADFLRELAAELGLEDEVEISEKNVEEPIDSVPIDDGNGGVEYACPNCGNEIPLWRLQGQNSEISNEAKDPEDVVPEEVKANEEPNVEVQGEDEKPAEETPAINVSVETANLDADKVEEVASAITDAVEDVEKPEGTTVAFGVGVLDDQVEEPVEEAICPECGKEICESKDNEDVAIAYVPEEHEPVTDKEKCHADIMKERQEYCKKNNTINVPIEIEKEIIKRNIKKYNIQPDAKYTLEENKVLTDFVQSEMAKGKSAEEVAETDEFKELAKEECKKDLEEASSAEKKAYHDGGEAMDDLIQGKAIARIKDQAARDAAVAAIKAGRPEVAKDFYGDRHENQAERSFEKKGEKMQNAGIHESSEVSNCDLEDKMLFVEEQEEMSDLELAEKFYKALEEKHCKHCNEEIAKDPYEKEVYLGYNTDDGDIVFVGTERYSSTEYSAVKDGDKYILSWDYTGDDGEREEGGSKEFYSIEALENAIKELHLEK